MPNKPYPSQIAPKPKKMSRRDISDDIILIPTPRKPKMKSAKKIDMGIMGSTEVQAKARQKQALDDMRKRGMLRKKQG